MSIFTREQALNAQASVIGSMLLDENCVGVAVQRLKPDFFDGVYRTLFEASCRIFRSGKPLDAITLVSQVGREYQETVIAILDATPTTANLDAYLDLVEDGYRVAQLQEVGQALLDAKSLDDCREAIAKANAVDALSCKRHTFDMEEMLLRFYNRRNGTQKTDFLPLPIPELGETVRVERGDMVVLGGYPSAGKTALALQIAIHAGKTLKVGIYSYETSADKLSDRFMAQLSGVALDRIKGNTLTESDYNRLVQVSQNRPTVEVIEASGMSVSDIKAHALSRKHDCILIDYLQKIAPEPHERRLPLFEQVSRTSNALQQFARSSGVYLIALSQLSRAEKKEGREVAPTMASLRQSGDIEQDADVILLLYLEESGKRDSNRILKLEKNKDGERYIAYRLAFDGWCQTFRMADSEENAPKKEEPEQTAWQEVTKPSPKLPF